MATATRIDDFTFSIFKFLCKEGFDGLSIYAIAENISQNSRELKSNLTNVKRAINNNPEYFHQEEDGNIYLKTLLRVCGFPVTHDEQCTSLHICKFFLLSNTCTFKHKCVYDHDFQSERNMKTLKKHNLHNLEFDEVRRLLLAHCNRTSETTPKVCVHHNRDDGCRKSLKCNDLHICNKFLDSKCKAKHCDKNHNVNDKQVITVLQKYGFHTSLDRNIVDLMKSIDKFSIESVGAPTSSTEFCHYFLSGGCLRRNCKFIHSKKPYLWRYFENQWHHFPDEINEELETKFCDPNFQVVELSEEYKNMHSVDFEKMLGSRLFGDFLKIDRIEPSPPNNWIWYWKSEPNTWKEICKLGIEEKNEVIEKYSKNSKNLRLHFQNSNTYGQMCFEKMELSHNSIQYPVRRRPKMELSLNSIPNPLCHQSREMESSHNSIQEPVSRRSKRSQ